MIYHIYSYLILKDRKIIVFTGTIGAGKTTCAKLFEQCLKQKGFSVYRYNEASLDLEEELKLFYRDKTRLFLFFQVVIMHLYKERSIHVKSLNFDYIIDDRTHKDVKVFNKFLEDDLEREYVNRKVDEIETAEPYKVVFVNPSVDITIKRKKKRNRKGENAEVQYLRKLYNHYQEEINTIYPTHVVFENNITLCKHCIKYDSLKYKKNCDISLYEIFFNQLL